MLLWKYVSLCYITIRYILYFWIADKHRPYLMTRVPGTNDYINAVFLDVSKTFLVQTLLLDQVVSKGHDLSLQQHGPWPFIVSARVMTFHCLSKGHDIYKHHQYASVEERSCRTGIAINWVHIELCIDGFCLVHTLNF